MTLIRKVVWRMMLASLILATPQVALASGDAFSVDGEGLEGIVDNLSDEAVENLIFSMWLAGCTERDPATNVNPWYGSSF